VHSISETEFEKVPFAENRTILGANLARPTFFGIFLGGEINNIEIKFAVLDLRWVFFGQRDQHKIWLRKVQKTPNFIKFGNFVCMEMLCVECRF
jgi:hypothetical protein